MICKICHTNETDSTSGICNKCLDGVYELNEKGEVVEIYNRNLSIRRH